MAFDDPGLLAEFVTESREHLADVEGQLLEIESGGANIDVDLVNQVFRAIHSIKGAAGFMGLTTVNKLAHSLENVLGRMRNTELIPNSAIIDVMLRAADALAGLINNIEGSNDVDVSSHVSTLDEINANGAAPGNAPAAANPPAETETADAAVDVTPGESHLPEEAAEPEPTPSVVPPAAESTPNVEPSPTKPKAAARPSSSSAPAETSIRVQVGVLDCLMNLAGELVLGRNQLLQTVNTDDLAGVQAVAARLDQVTSELQEAIMQTRMQPIGNVFGKFPRVVRDLSAKLGKQCEVVTEGKEVEVDKTIVEAIGDPLTHLVRNSVDHGVEMPDVRSAAGKNPAGKIELRAYHQAGKVRIDINDDGGGIDAEKLKQKAVAKGVITAERAAEMSQREAVRLIFHPGFSTAEKISDVSGRGVGMDVVRTNIEKLGGTVDVESNVGSGTSIQITLPLTLAIIPSMLIRCRGERFAIPQVNIVELVRVRASEAEQRISRVKGAHVLRLRGSLLPLVELDRALGIANEDERATTGEAKHIVVVESGQFRYGLIVDEIDDSEEIVVKPLGRHLKTANCLAGATILGDGHVAPILDVSGIAGRSELRASTEESTQEHLAQDPDSAGERQSLLLFSNCPGEHFAVPMSLIARIERVRSEQIDTVGGQELLQYRNASLPLLSIEQFINAQPRVETDHIYVVVFNIQGREAGLVAPELYDIRELAVDIDGDTFREPGVAGSMVIDERTTRLLDLYELAMAAHAEWFSEKAAPTEATAEERTILLAEDSSFFRKQVKTYMESEGFQVVDCEDGQEAWETLTAGGHFDLVITDIEMPRLNGFELSRRIKDAANFQHLPIIALTSLASDEDRRRGMEAGIDEYQVKIDREKVMKAIWKLLDSKPQPKTVAGPTETHTHQECLA